MNHRKPAGLTASGLRSEVMARALKRSAGVEHEVTYGRTPSVLFAPDDAGGHGNFLGASYRRILADPAWAARLSKVYTSEARVPRRHDRRRAELECAGSSDALLMNVFCYPGVLRRSAVCNWLGVASGLRPAFGVRAALPMRGDEVDRTELDMVVGDVLVEAKLTEGGFGRASRDRLERYDGMQEIFDLGDLPQGGGQYAGYQILRGVVAASRAGGRYAVLLDERRHDLQEICFRVLRAVRTAEAQTRFSLLTWQDLAVCLPRTLQALLADKYGIMPSRL